MSHYQKAARAAMYRFLEKSGGPTAEQQRRERRRCVIARAVYTCAHVVLFLAIAVEALATMLALAGNWVLWPIQPAAGFLVLAAAVAAVVARRFRYIRPRRGTC